MSPIEQKLPIFYSAEVVRVEINLNPQPSQTRRANATDLKTYGVFVAALGITMVGIYTAFAMVYLIEAGEIVKTNIESFFRHPL